MRLKGFAAVNSKCTTKKRMHREKKRMCYQSGFNLSIIEEAWIAA